MHFGIFLEEMRKGLSQGAAFQEAFATAERADAWGIDCVWLGEIHFTPNRSVISSSLQVASSIVTRTKRLRVGTAVTVLPLSHPLRIAEDVATIDHISEGRFEFGVGRSGVVKSYDTYGIPYGESQARFREALEIIRLAFRGEPFSYDGEFYRITNATLCPTPYQKPHPPMRMAATTRETFASVARMGLACFIGIRVNEIPDLQEDLALYRRTWRESGHAGDGSVYLRIPVYVTTTARGGVEEPRQSLSAFFGRQTELARAAVGRAGTSEARRAQAERMAALSYEDVLARKVVSGTPERVIDRLRELREALNLDGFIVELNPGGLIAEELETRSLRLLTHEVIPAFR
jgi:alkanesulfonate monooxygenase SsuD/methylene tetrahydromethanopterin reductase-like flavin-dependent oxidoreductase (luciferase family)